MSDTVAPVDEAARPDLRRHAVAITALLGVVLILTNTRLGDWLESPVLDAGHRVLSQYFPKASRHEVVLVGIDEASFRAFPEPPALWHRHLGKFMGAMAQARPAVVGVDVVLPTRSYDELVPGLDATLMVGLVRAARASTVVLGRTIEERGAPRLIHAPFQAAVAGVPGYVLLAEDTDGVIRRFSEHLGADGVALPTLPGQMARPGDATTLRVDRLRPWSAACLHPVATGGRVG